MKYVILGASAAGISGAKTLRKLDKDAEITVISKDDKVYSRCMLHYIISGEKDEDDLNFAGNDFFIKNNIDWIKWVGARKLDVNNKVILLDDDREITYDKLLISTGASSFIPPIKNLREAKEVYGLRNLKDSIRIKEKANKGKRVVVLGAGLVGIDAVVGLLERDVKVSVIEMSKHILPTQLDDYSAKRYEELLKSKGVDIYTEVKAEDVEVDQENNINSISLSNGKTLDCDMVISATGVRPNIDFIEENTLEIENGIVTNDKCETNVKDIYAAGDVRGESPIWPLAVKEGMVAAHNMVGKERILDDKFGFRNSMNFLGLQTISLGDINNYEEEDDVDIIEYGDNYKKIIHKDGIIKGAIIQGDISYSGVLIKLIRNKINISHINKNIFDIDYGDFFSIKENGEYEYKKEII